VHGIAVTGPNNPDNRKEVVNPSERVQARFAASIEVNRHAAESQAAAIADAAQTIVTSLLGGGKVLSCGNGCSAADAQYFAAHMQHRFERDRPGLPALALNSDAAILTAIAVDDGFDAVFAKQIGALGHPGDVLLALSINGTASNMTNALAAARERQMRVVALSDHAEDSVAIHLAHGDIAIRAPATDPSLVLENHRLVLHCLCDLVDLHLMGG